MNKLKLNISSHRNNFIYWNVFVILQTWLKFTYTHTSTITKTYTESLTDYRHEWALGQTYYYTTWQWNSQETLKMNPSGQEISNTLLISLKSIFLTTQHYLFYFIID